MSYITKEDILEKAKYLAKIIAATEEVTFYKNAELQLNENQKVNDLINQIKDLQKQAVNLKHIEKFNALGDTEILLDRLQTDLDEMPIIQDYKHSQYEVNELLQMVTTVISDTISQELNNAKKE